LEKKIAKKEKKKKPCTGPHKFTTFFFELFSFGKEVQESQEEHHDV